MNMKSTTNTTQTREFTSDGRRNDHKYWKPQRMGALFPHISKNILESFLTDQIIKPNGKNRRKRTWIFGSSPQVLEADAVNS